MEIGEYATLASREQTYFWHVGRREILREALQRHGPRVPQEVLDIGCGTGGNILLLKDFGKVTGVDLYDEALKFSASRGFDKLLKGDATALPFADASYDLATALDVLEHIPDDAAAMREAYRVLKPGGYFLVTVPAYQWLFSQHDLALHHVRRYSDRDLLAKIKAAGFSIVEKAHFSTMSVPINALRKLRDIIFRPKNAEPQVYDVVFRPFINSILLFILRCEKIVLRFISLPFGTSILIVAKKPSEIEAALMIPAIASREDLKKCGFAEFVEWTPCDICGGDDFSVLYQSRYSAGDFSKNRVKSFAYASADKARGNIVQCRGCSLVYMTPRDKNVYALYENVEDEYYFSSRDERTENFKRDLQGLHRTLNVSAGEGKKLLDIGCSYGFFIDVAKKFGWHAYGCELSKKEFEFASKNHDTVCNQQVAHCGFPDNFFDVVTLHDVLEHVTSPSGLLRDIYRVLKPGGVLMITTPDISSPSARIMGRYWINFARMHLYYFTPQTIAGLLGKTGFATMNHVRHRRVAKLGMMVRWMSKYPAIYAVCNLLLNNKFTKDIAFSSSLSGNMTVYAKKM